MADITEKDRTVPWLFDHGGREVADAALGFVRRFVRP